MANRVKFFSTYDLSIGFYMTIVEKKLDIFDENIDYTDINDILEFENIKYFIENNIFHKDWTDKKIEDYKNKIEKFPKVLGKFFSKIKENNIIDEISKLSNEYIENFWELFTEYKVYKRISEDKFRNILKLDKCYINNILHFEKIVKYYDSVIKEYLLSNIDDSVECFLIEYFEEKERKQKKIFFPISLTKVEKEKLLDLYITEDLKKINYFQLILKSYSQSELSLSPVLKRKVKKIYDKLIEDNFKKNNNAFTYEYGVEFKPNQFSVKIFSQEEINGKLILKTEYSLDWVREYLDYPTLLNNFIYLLELVDKFFIFININYEKELGIFEKFNGKGKKEYKIGTVFNFKRTKTESDFYIYYQVLKENNIRLEEILEWFFKEYLYKEFEVKNFVINFPSKNLTYLEKCKCIIGEIEKVIKQFSLYRDYNEVDNEVLELLSEQISFENIKSLLNEKYIYIENENNIIKTILFHLFSDQSDLCYVKNKDTSYKNFIQMINSEKIDKSIFLNYQLPIIEFLLKEDIIQEDKEGYLCFNLKLIILLKELYEKEVLCSNYLGEGRKEIEFLKNKNMLQYENTLFSKKESEYLNYFLNSKFSNGLELRNKYAHGTHSLDEVQHQIDYFKFLEIIVLIVIKINEEFCLYDKLKVK